MYEILNVTNRSFRSKSSINSRFVKTLQEGLKAKENGAKLDDTPCTCTERVLRS